MTDYETTTRALLARALEIARRREPTDADRDVLLDVTRDTDAIAKARRLLEADNEDGTRSTFEVERARRLLAAAALHQPIASPSPERRQLNEWEERLFAANGGEAYAELERIAPSLREVRARVRATSFDATVEPAYLQNLSALHREIQSILGPESRSDDARVTSPLAEARAFLYLLSVGGYRRSGNWPTKV